MDGDEGLLQSGLAVSENGEIVIVGDAMDLDERGFYRETFNTVKPRHMRVFDLKVH